MSPTSPLRRRLLVGGAALPFSALSTGCGTPLPLRTASAPAVDSRGDAILAESAEAHGWTAFRTLTDINIAYGGQWRPVIDRIQPVVVDKTYRGPSEERLMPLAGVVAQAYTGPAGRKNVFWRRDGAEIAVWYDGKPSADDNVLAASALVAECYGLFLLGPLWARSRGLAAVADGTERFDGRLHDRLQLWARPGFGRAPLDRVTLLVDRSTRIAHRLRFTLEGMASTQGAVAEVDTFEHARRFGVLWPMRSYEEVVHPFRIPAHDWFVTGLDVNRGYGPEALKGPAFTGAAAAPAAKL